MADFGKRPPQRKVFVRLQDIGPDSHPTQTQSMNVWDATFEQVLSVVTAALEAAFGGDQAEEPAPTRKPIKAKVGKSVRS